jgi:hypothetical protein
VTTKTTLAQSSAAGKGRICLREIILFETDGEKLKPKKRSQSSKNVFILPTAVQHLGVVISYRIILMLIFQTSCVALIQAESPNVIGRWNIEITFANDEHRSLRFDAQGAGKGTFLVLDPRLNVWGPAKPSEAKWSPAEGDSVTFSGPVEFMLGNVGRDAGTLMFNGRFETADLIKGEVEFSPLVGDRPSKHGTFKAARAGGG